MNRHQKHSLNIVLYTRAFLSTSKQHITARTYKAVGVMTTPLSTAKNASGAQYRNNNQQRPQFYKYCVRRMYFNLINMKIIDKLFIIGLGLIICFNVSSTGHLKVLFFCGILSIIYSFVYLVIRGLEDK